jgi:hypothetical protein
VCRGLAAGVIVTSASLEFYRVPHCTVAAVSSLANTFRDAASGQRQWPTFCWSDTVAIVLAAVGLAAYHRDKVRCPALCGMHVM